MEEESSAMFSDKSMKRTIKDLLELDEKFTRDCKRQRQQIESSEILGEEAVDLPKDAFHPVLVKPKKEVLTADDGQESSFNIDMEKAPMGQEEGRKVAKAVIKSRKENDENLDETLGGGNQRPPPFNSEYLPLPWQGRLGYVADPPFSPSSALGLSEGFCIGTNANR
jgi:hypothetical protein